jgi:hypothetical protein
MKHEFFIEMPEYGDDNQGTEALLAELRRSR